MKTRNGFVSNSSSTSFMIAVKGEGKFSNIRCECCGFTPLDLLTFLNAQKGKNEYYDVKSAKEQLADKIDETKDALKWVNERVTRYEKMLADPNTKKVIMELDEILRWQKSPKDSNFIRVRSHREEREFSADIIEREVEGLHKITLDTELKKAERRLASLKDIPNDWRIYNIESSWQGNYQQDEELINKFVEAKQAVIIEKETKS